MADSAQEISEFWEPDADDNPEIFTLDGTRIGVEATDDEHSRFVVIASPDRDAVVRRVANARNIAFINSDPNDLASVMNELIAQDWESRWPKWPRWLARRLSGSGPFRVPGAGH